MARFPLLPQDSLGLFASNRRVIKPERIIIVRHGESLGNLDESVSKPDYSYVRRVENLIARLASRFVRLGCRKKLVRVDHVIFVSSLDDTIRHVGHDLDPTVCRSHKTGSSQVCMEVPMSLGECLSCFRSSKTFGSKPFFFF